MTDEELEEDLAAASGRVFRLKEQYHIVAAQLSKIRKELEIAVKQLEAEKKNAERLLT